VKKTTKTKNVKKKECELTSQAVLRCHAKSLNYSCMSVILLLRVKKVLDLCFS